MIMNPLVFREKIEAGKVIIYGRYSFYKMSGDYYFHGEETEIFKTWEEFWRVVASYVLYGVNYFERG